MPDPSTSCSFPFEPYKRPKESERTVEEVEGIYNIIKQITSLTRCYCCIWENKS